MTHFTLWKEPLTRYSRALPVLDHIAVLRTYMPRIVTDRVAWSVGLSVGLSPSEPRKNG